jgi:hypothetical protein
MLRRMESFENASEQSDRYAETKWWIISRLFFLFGKINNCFRVYVLRRLRIYSGIFREIPNWIEGSTWHDMVRCILHLILLSCPSLTKRFLDVMGGAVTEPKRRFRGCKSGRHIQKSERSIKTQKGILSHSPALMGSDMRSAWTAHNFLQYILKAWIIFRGDTDHHFRIYSWS